MIDIKTHWSRLAEMGCMVCKRPAIIHHCMGGSMKEAGFHKGMGQKNSDWLVIPLCPNHHNGDQGLHIIGVLSWEKKHGKQIDMLNEISGLIGWRMYPLEASTAEAYDATLCSSVFGSGSVTSTQLRLCPVWSNGYVPQVFR